MAAEFLYRSLTSGFYGSLTQAFRKVEPAWTAALAVLILLPLRVAFSGVGDSLGAGHTETGAQHRRVDHIHEVSTLFNLYAMRRGALVVGSEASSMGSDLRQIPDLIAGFVLCGLRHIKHCFNVLFLFTASRS